VIAFIIAIASIAVAGTTASATGASGQASWSPPARPLGVGIIWLRKRRTASP
jgi:hypothetical protein